MTTRNLAPSDVFINVPFDSQYEPLFLALIAGLVSLGLNPRSVVQIGGSTDRLRRLLEIIQECPFSIHDLSRVQASGRGSFRVPRFNMPFELGLAAAVSMTASGTARQWRVIESVRRVSTDGCESFGSGCRQTSMPLVHSSGWFSPRSRLSPSERASLVPNS